MEILLIKTSYSNGRSYELEGCNVGTARNGKRYIRSNADGDESNNLDQLPTF